MKILVFGDIFARPGREAIKNHLPRLKVNYKPDLVIANGENLHHGKGASLKNLQELRAAGIDFFTSGNHVFKEKSLIYELSNPHLPFVIPANLPKACPGNRFLISKVNNKTVLILNLLGRIYMQQQVQCPFQIAEEIISNNVADLYLVDFHGEATSEKIAFAKYFENKINLIYGTHTHVQTSDLRRLTPTTAFITDIGMTGVIDSIIGMKPAPVIQGFITQMPQHNEPADGKSIVNAILVEFDFISSSNPIISHLETISFIE